MLSNEQLARWERLRIAADGEHCEIERDAFYDLAWELAPALIAEMRGLRFHHSLHQSEEWRRQMNASHKYFEQESIAERDALAKEVLDAAELHLADETDIRFLERERDALTKEVQHLEAAREDDLQRYREDRAGIVRMWRESTDELIAERDALARELAATREALRHDAVCVSWRSRGHQACICDVGAVGQARGE